jgi:asparagine synthase (glutamine-hydrolysing)
MKPYLPAYILNARKRGLNLPVARWFREDLRGWLESTLSPERLAARGHFRPSSVRDIMTEHLNGQRDHSLFLWALLTLELWYQQAGAS